PRPAQRATRRLAPGLAGARVRRRSASRGSHGRYAHRMIGIALIREDPEGVKRAVARKGESTEPIDRILEADGRRRILLAETDAAKHERNEGSSRVGELVREGRKDEAEAAKAALAGL